MADYQARVDIDSASLGQLSKAANGAQGAIAGFSAVMSGDFVNGTRQLLSSWRNVTQSLSGASMISFGPLLVGLAAIVAGIKLWEMAAEKALVATQKAAAAAKDAAAGFRSEGYLPGPQTASETRAAGMVRGGDTTGLKAAADAARAEAERLRDEGLALQRSSGGDNDRRAALITANAEAFKTAANDAKVYEAALKELAKAEEAAAGENRARELIGKEGVALAKVQVENAAQELAIAREKLAVAKTSAEISKAQIDLERALTGELQAQAALDSAVSAQTTADGGGQQQERARDLSQGDYLADVQRAISTGTFDSGKKVRNMSMFNESALGEGLMMGRGRVQSLSAKEPSERSWEEAAKRTADNTERMVEILRNRLGMAD